MALDIQHTFLERFLRYVQIDTQSDPSSKTIPSTEKQKNLGKVLVEELREMGVEDAHLDEHGYIYATIPANTDKENVPVICFCSHMDTSPDCSGKGVKPIIHRNYDGSDITLPDDPTVILRPKDHPNLKEQIGNDIITASGTTLLGADNKAGLAEIMDAAHYLITHPEIRHGKIRILFTPDEEIGRGVDKVDMDKLGADYGYTVDGEKRGSLEDETFSADAVTIDIRGVSIHPGFAKGKLESALKIAADIVAALPKDRLSPETTEGKEGFIHPISISGGAELAKIEFIIRDFTDEMLEHHENFLRGIMDEVLQNYPNSRAEFKVTEQYRNMKMVLDKHPQVVEYAMEAMRRAGVEPLRSSIRGGTDGSRLSFMGLPCPNIFAGEQAFHSREEWCSVQDMEKAVQVIVQLAKVWEERS
ncbi:MAG: peptidase T [Phaeodactylibacter sp.]|nr:peptidase T [Phaeodactylibacter sp.]